MKFASFPLNKTLRFYLFTFVLLISFSLSVFPQTEQSAQLSLADILIALRSKKATLPEKNKILAEAVKVRGITFSLTPEIEKELTTTGADSELVNAIRQKNPIVKTVEKPVVKPQPTPVPTPTAFDIQRRANLSISNGEFDLAIADLNKVIEMKAADAATYLNRGFSYFNKKDFNLALADYDKAIELNPKELMAYLKRAEANEKAGNIEKAIADYQKVTELDSENETAKNNLKRLQDEIAKTKAETQPQPTQANKEDVSPTNNSPQTVNLGSINGLAVDLAMPAYPALAKKSNVFGKVTVQVTLDEEGKVTSAKVIEGPTLLRSVSEDAARKSKFKPALINGQAVKATGFITYNFKGN